MLTQCAVEGPLELLFGRVHIDIALREDDLARRPAAAAPSLPPAGGGAAGAAGQPQAVEIKDPPARPARARTNPSSAVAADHGVPGILSRMALRLPP